MIKIISEEKMKKSLEGYGEKKLKESKLNEAPDEYGIPYDSEVMAKYDKEISHNHEVRYEIKGLDYKIDQLMPKIQELISLSTIENWFSLKFIRKGDDFYYYVGTDSVEIREGSGHYWWRTMTVYKNGKRHIDYNVSEYNNVSAKVQCYKVFVENFDDLYEKAMEYFNNNGEKKEESLKESIDENNYYEIITWDYENIPTSTQHKTFREAKKEFIKCARFHKNKRVRVSHIVDGEENVLKDYDKDDIEESLKESIDEDNDIKEDVISWISDHDQAYEDFLYYFDINDEELDEFGEFDSSLVKLEDVIDWISEHRQLWEDFLNYFNLEDSEEKTIKDFVNDLKKGYYSESLQEDTEKGTFFTKGRPAYLVMAYPDEKVLGVFATKGAARDFSRYYETQRPEERTAVLLTAYYNI